MFLTLSLEEKNSLDNIYEFGYVFDWTKPSSSRSETVACVFRGDLAGLVEFERQPENRLNYMHLIEVATSYRGTGTAGKLLAYVAKDALEQEGFEGFVLFESKTVLNKYYQEKYGAKPLANRSNRLFFDTEASKALVKYYLQEGE